MLRYGDADVVISHAPEAEARMLASHRCWLYRKVMFNTFVIVGPNDDPAGVRQAASAPDAMRRIAASAARFVSRGDQSGTHEREQLLWKLAGTAPADGALLTSGSGMSTTLRQAAERRAYTLTDKPTFLRLQQSIDLSLLFEGGRELMNTYAVVVGDGGDERRRIAEGFAEWLVRGNGRASIDEYRVGGRQAFTPWPSDANAGDPRALPH